MTTLECFMDELIDCFEDFAKKSLFLLTLAVGAIGLMVYYALRILSVRVPGLRDGPRTSGPSQLMLEGTQSIPNFCDDTGKFFFYGNVRVRLFFIKKAVHRQPDGMQTAPLRLQYLLGVDNALQT